MLVDRYSWGSLVQVPVFVLARADIPIASKRVDSGCFLRAIVNTRSTKWSLQKYNWSFLNKSSCSRYKNAAVRLPCFPQTLYVFSWVPRVFLASPLARPLGEWESSKHALVSVTALVMRAHYCFQDGGTRATEKWSLTALHELFLEFSWLSLTFRSPVILNWLRHGEEAPPQK